jgi:hypothetical protein
MSKSKVIKSQKRCAYCGITGAATTKDHVVPRCLWEKHSRPQHLVTVPACRNCNSSFSHDETNFRNILLLMLPENEVSSGADAVRNGAFLRSIQKGMLNTQEIITRSNYVPVITDHGLYAGHRYSLQIDVGRINRVIGKIVRGFFYYKSDQTPLPKTHVVAIWGGNSFWQECEDIIDLMSDFKNLGDTEFQARFLIDGNDPNRTFHLYCFYKTLGFFAATLPAEELGIANAADLDIDATFPLSISKPPVVLNI